MPDTPTIAEMGLPGYEGILWIGMVAPAGTPKAVIDRLAAANARAARAADVVERFAKHRRRSGRRHHRRIRRPDRARTAAVARAGESGQYQAAIVPA